ncbi:Uma2 family endonuclease [Actinophytocola sp.]|uniref:Uma2 family endonuclease n=1 Tax=Actinophytocola sp. TaxID=1872138 RepID=UPI002EDB8874
MTVLPWPDHLLTLQEWDALPEDTSRHYELVEGVLIVSPRAASMHQRASRWIAHTLEEQLPDRLTALQDMEVVIDARFPATVRAPDVVVATNELAEQNLPRFFASDVLLAVEIISPGSRKQDRVMKPAEYAEAGIPDYWLIDLEEPATLTAYLLVDGYYEIVAEVTDEVRLSGPAPVTLDVRKLTARR